MKKILNMALLVSFILTMLVPITGIHVHKLASVLFLALSFVHMILYGKKMSAKRAGLMGVILFAFVTGILGMILDEYTIVLALHKVSSMAVIFFLAIHIFLFRNRLCVKTK